VAEQDSGEDRDNTALPSEKPISLLSTGAPLPPIRELDTDNLARFVSATTIATATSTTLSASFVKHRGHPPRSVAGIRVIKPDDVHGMVPEKVGKMKYDKNEMKWVREVLDKVDEAGESRVGGSEESEDVFAGMESWGRGTPAERSAATAEIPQSQHKADDASLIEDREVSDVEDGRIASPPRRPLPVHAESAPAILTPAPAANGSLRPIRSALRNANSATPAGMPKKRAGWHESVTPAGGSESKRSVSFSDGKKSGKIDLFAEEGGAEKSWMPSARTKRIEGILGDMKDLSTSFFPPIFFPYSG